MTSKLIGAALLMLASVMYGRMKIAEERRRTELIDGLAAFVRGIRDNIAHFRRPLGEIFDSLSIPALDDCGFMELCRSGGIRAAWESFSPKLPPETRAVMDEFSRRIGGGYREDELELCGYTLACLEKTAADASAERIKREKLYRNLPPLAALSVVLLAV